MSASMLFSYEYHRTLEKGADIAVVYQLQAIHRRLMAGLDPATAERIMEHPVVQRCMSSTLGVRGVLADLVEVLRRHPGLADLR